MAIPANPPSGDGGYRRNSRLSSRANRVKNDRPSGDGGYGKRVDQRVVGMVLQRKIHHLAMVATEEVVG
jgi:hypothetical protein